MIWSEEAYWLKAKLYVQRAQEADRDDSLYPYWLSLAMEFIARAALSKVSPVLNAEPQSKENLYYALGLETTGTPKTLPLHSIFIRCVDVVDGFETHHQKFCDLLGVQRNEELHTGGLPFEGLKLHDWLQKYYGVLEVLCRHLGHDLDEILGPAEAEAAHELLKANQEGLLTLVKQSIADKKREFDAKPEDERERLVNQAGASARLVQPWSRHRLRVDCPACTSQGIVFGRQLRSSKPYFEDDRLLEQVICLSESYLCLACGLSLPTASHVQLSGVIEPQFSVDIETSLHELQMMDYYEEEFMNE